MLSRTFRGIAVVVMGGCLSAACLPGCHNSAPLGSLKAGGTLAPLSKTPWPCSRHSLRLELRGGSPYTDTDSPAQQYTANPYMSGLIDAAEAAAVLPSAPIDSSAEGISYGATTAEAVAAVAANTGAPYSPTAYVPSAGAPPQYTSTQQSYEYAIHTPYASGTQEPAHATTYEEIEDPNAERYAYISASPAFDAASSIPERVVTDRPAVLAAAVGLSSPRAQLGGDFNLLEETDQFLTESGPALMGDVKSVATGVKMNRLYVQRCRSVLERTVDSFTRKQVESRISQLESDYDAAGTISPTTQASMYKSSSQPVLASTVEEEFELEALKRMIGVTFEVRCDMTEPEEKVLIIGGCKELGAWNELAAVEMSTTEMTWPLWTATVHLPAGRVIEYKYAVGVKGLWLNQYNVKSWEGHMGNRSFKVGRRRHTMSDEFYTPFYKSNPRPPSFVHMGSGGDFGLPNAECFQDPEYSFVPMD